MRRPGRLRRVVKWGGFGLSLFVGAAWVMSWFSSVDYHRSMGDRGVVGFLTRGHIVVFCFYWPFSLGKPFRVTSWDPEGWSMSRPFSVEVPSWADHGLDVPLWLPFVLVLLPTAFLWHRDPRPLPGHCRKCGYDLTGNESGVCPECGERI